MSTDGTPHSPSDSDLGKLIAQVDEQHGEDGAAAMADELRDKTAETASEPEAPGDLED